MPTVTECATDILSCETAFPGLFIQGHQYDSNMHPTPVYIPPQQIYADNIKTNATLQVEPTLSLLVRTESPKLWAEYSYHGCKAYLELPFSRAHNHSWEQVRNRLEQNTGLNFSLSWSDTHYRA